MPFIQATYNLMKSKFAEPLEIIWNLLMPSAFLILVNYQFIGRDVDSQTFLSRIQLFLGWTVSISSIYGVGMLAASWRNSGMLDVFVQGKIARHRLIKLFLAYQIGSSFVSSFCIIFISMILFRIEPTINLLSLGISSTFGGVVVGAASLIILRLNWSLQNISTTISVLVIFFAWVAPQIPEKSSYHYVNILNPIYFTVSFIRFFQSENINITNFLISLALCFLAAAFGYIAFMRGSVWKRH